MDKVKEVEAWINWGKEQGIIERDEETISGRHKKRSRLYMGCSSIVLTIRGIYQALRRA